MVRPSSLDSHDSLDGGNAVGWSGDLRRRLVLLVTVVVVLDVVDDDVEYPPIIHRYHCIPFWSIISFQSLWYVVPTIQFWVPLVVRHGVDVVSIVLGGDDGSDLDGSCYYCSK